MASTINERAFSNGAHAATAAAPTGNGGGSNGHSDRMARWAPVIITAVIALGNAVFTSGSRAATSAANDKRLDAVDEWRQVHVVDHTQLSARTSAVELRVSGVEARAASHEQKFEDIMARLAKTDANVLAVCIATHAQCSR